MVGDELAQHRDEDVHGMRGVPFLIGQALAAERVVSAVHLRTAVDEEERRPGHFDRGYHSDSCLSGPLAAWQSCSRSRVPCPLQVAAAASSNSNTNTKKSSTCSSMVRQRRT